MVERDSERKPNNASTNDVINELREDFPPDPEKSKGRKRVKVVLGCLGTGVAFLGGIGATIALDQDPDEAAIRAEAVLESRGIFPVSSKFSDKGRLVKLACKSDPEKGAVAAISTGANHSHPVARLKHYPGFLDYSGKVARGKVQEVSYALEDPAAREAFYTDTANYCPPDERQTSTTTTRPATPSSVITTTTIVPPEITGIPNPAAVTTTTSRG